jgi:ribosome biogenesis GTPase / thiamine phosphate phosphatase
MKTEQLTGRILRGIGGLYWIEGPDGVSHPASVRGLFRKNQDVPLPGDIVTCEPSGDPDRPWRITRIHPRRNSLVRPAVANLDGMVITVSASNPPPDWLLVDKLLIISLVYGIEPVLILTKTDLDNEDFVSLKAYESVGCLILQTQPGDANDIGRLERWLCGKIACLAGQSGVGKSTLLNRLRGETVMPVGKISERIGRGRHTTREVIFFSHAGGYLADTPGFSTLTLKELGVTPGQVVQGYPEIMRVADACRFNDCRHFSEPGCAVSDASIDPGRLERYRILRRQLEEATDYTTSKKKS